MKAKALFSWVAGLVMVAASVQGMAQGNQAGTTLGTVRLPQAVSANGQPLPAGTYTVRLTSDPVTPAVGQSPEAEQWVEFVQNGQVRGRELASVVTGPDAKQVLKITPPTSGAAKVQLLRGGEYLRVWLNRGGTHYLVHLATGQRS
jgi:hypothetical protein